MLACEGARFASPSRPSFFFGENKSWTSLVEVRLNDRDGNSAGIFDVVLVSYDERGKVTDFGALEVQAVYISGNVRGPFDQYMTDGTTAGNWSVRPDFLSSSRKRLAPQLVFKGGILNTWGKRQAVALQTHFYSTLPELPRIADPQQADMMWLLYDLERDATTDRFRLVLKDTIYTQFEAALIRLTKPRVGPMQQFVAALQRSLDSKLIPPDAPALTDLPIIEDSPEMEG